MKLLLQKNCGGYLLCFVFYTHNEYHLVLLLSLSLLYLCSSGKYQYLANHVGKVYVAVVGYCSRIVCYERYSMDLCSIKRKGSYPFDSYDMMETLYTYEVESDF